MDLILIMRAGRPACSLFRSRAHLDYMTWPHAWSTIAHVDRPVHIARAPTFGISVFSPHRVKVETNASSSLDKANQCAKDSQDPEGSCNTKSSTSIRVMGSRMYKFSTVPVLRRVAVSLNRTSPWRPELPDCMSEYGRSRSSPDRRAHS